jgi:hypothetical protein
MSWPALTEAVALAGKVGHVFIATADPSGRAHLAAARRLSPGPGKQVSVFINQSNFKFLEIFSGINKYIITVAHHHPLPSSRIPSVFLPVRQSGGLAFRP